MRAAPCRGARKNGLRKNEKNITQDTHPHIGILYRHSGTLQLCYIRNVLKRGKRRDTLGKKDLPFASLLPLLCRRKHRVLQLHRAVGRHGYPLHCAATMLGVYLCVLLPAGMESRQRLVGFMTALVIYIAAMVVYALIAKHVKKTVTEEKNFRSQSADKAGKSKNENE